MTSPTPEQLIADDNRRRLDSLTDREHEVLVLLSKGLTMRQVAGQLVVSLWTVIDHGKAVRKKLGVSSTVEAAVIAAKAGLV